MSKIIESVWISANHSFQRFDNTLIRHLSRGVSIARWEYYQHQDEASSWEIALDLLSSYLESLAQPINLVGHGTGGTIGLLYAQKYPEKVKSLTLLGVGFHPEIDWQVHYYTMRALLPCSQKMILAQMVQKLFGKQNQYNTKGLIEILRQDLNTSPSPHSLFKKVSIKPQGIKPPLMVCGSQNDSIVDPNALKGWYGYFKEDDVLWECEQGNHFFHYFYPQKVSREILKFWRLSLNNQQVEENTTSKLSKLAYLPSDLI
ncbi:MAG: alpha/beta hydrolase [Xenococcaceae cyanobacterium MO_167.B52]|nr:alpha/beta hydrolase [Xenococcaceae cyanobacterium MO_167.B52]